MKLYYLTYVRRPQNEFSQEVLCRLSQNTPAISLDRLQLVDLQNRLAKAFSDSEYHIKEIELANPLQQKHQRATEHIQELVSNDMHGTIAARLYDCVKKQRVGIDLLGATHATEVQQLVCERNCFAAGCVALTLTLLAVCAGWLL